VIQVSDLAGAYAVTFLLAAVNALLFELLYTRRWFRNLFNLADEPPRSRYALPLQFAGVKLLLASVLAYGGWRLRQNDFAAGPRVALIQGNLEQAVRNDRDHPDGGAAAKKSMVRHYRDLSDQAALQQPDLIVWPETSYPDDWLVTPDGQPHKESLELARIVADRWHTEVLLGLNVRALRVEQPSLRYNSAVLIQADGGVGERYDKIHRVPFGEYVPFKDWLPLMEQFAPYDFDYSVAQGEHLTRFRLGKYRFGVLICYEDSDPYLARQYARADSDGPAVDFLLNISNDGWFDGTSEHEEHLAICRFRAVECRRSVARAVNMGISAVIDGNGRVVALPAASWTQSKSIEAVLTAEIPLDRRTSLYAHWGDWLPWGCWLVLALGVGWGLVRKKPLPMAT
jgi:apolipoprotein N-acyltransferase